MHTNSLIMLYDRLVYSIFYVMKSYNFREWYQVKADNQDTFEEKTKQNAKAVLVSTS